MTRIIAPNAPTAELKEMDRRGFLKRMGWTLVGGILLPYVPKTFFSIPKEITLPTVKDVWNLAYMPYMRGEIFWADMNRRMKAFGYLNTPLQKYRHKRYWGRARP